MTPDSVTAIFTGLTGVIAALAAFTANRSKRVSDNQHIQRTRIRLLERQIVAYIQHTFLLERALAAAGGVVPARPKILEDSDDEK